MLVCHNGRRLGIVQSRDQCHHEQLQRTALISPLRRRPLLPAKRIAWVFPAVWLHVGHKKRHELLIKGWANKWKLSQWFDPRVQTWLKTAKTQIWSLRSVTLRLHYIEFLMKQKKISRARRALDRAACPQCSCEPGPRSLSHGCSSWLFLSSTVLFPICWWELEQPVSVQAQVHPAVPMASCGYGSSTTTEQGTGVGDGRWIFQRYPFNVQGTQTALIAMHSSSPYLTMIQPGNAYQYAWFVPQSCSPSHIWLIPLSDLLGVFTAWSYTHGRLHASIIYIYSFLTVNEHVIYNHNCSY